MSRVSTPRHAQTAGDLGFAVQLNAETPWHKEDEVEKTFYSLTSTYHMCNIYIELFDLCSWCREHLSSYFFNAS